MKSPKNWPKNHLSRVTASRRMTVPRRTGSRAPRTSKAYGRVPRTSKAYGRVPPIASQWCSFDLCSTDVHSYSTVMPSSTHLPLALGASLDLNFLIIHCQNRPFYQNPKISPESRMNHFISTIESWEVDLTLSHLDLTWK